MIEGETFVCFGDDWGSYPSSLQRVFNVLRRKNRVIWFNSIAQRSPSLAWRDLYRLLKKGMAMLARGENRIDNLSVHNIFVIPLPQYKIIREFNGWSVRRKMRRLIDSYQLSKFTVVTGNPVIAEWIGTLGEEMAIYYCMDDHANYPGMSGRLMRQLEPVCLGRVDLVLCTSRLLMEDKRPSTSRVALLPQGVDVEIFRCDRSGSDSTGLSGRLPRPIIGFYGTLGPWVDFNLIRDIAERRPTWSIVLIGPVEAEIDAVRGMPNIHLFGKMPNASLPAMAKDFSVGLIPYVINDMTRRVNSLKLLEYLALGLPIVSRPLPEVETYGGLVYRADDVDGFVRAIELALREDSEELRRERRETAVQNTWEARAEQFSEYYRELRSKADVSSRAV